MCFSVYNQPPFVVSIGINFHTAPNRSTSVPQSVRAMGGIFRYGASKAVVTLSFAQYCFSSDSCWVGCPGTCRVIIIIIIFRAWKNGESSATVRSPSCRQFEGPVAGWLVGSGKRFITVKVMIRERVFCSFPSIQWFPIRSGQSTHTHTHTHRGMGFLWEIVFGALR